MSYTNDKPDLASLSDFLLHYGVGHLGGGHSGRYPWMSGDDPGQHNAADFVARVDLLRKQKIEYVEKNPNSPDYGKTFYGNTAIAKHMGYSTKDFRNYYTICLNEIKTKEYNRIKELADSGMGATEIGREVGKTESSVRSILKSNVADRQAKAQATADFIKSRIDEDGMIMVGSDVEKYLPGNVTRNKFDVALTMVQMEGYPIYSVRVPQVTNPKNGHQTTVKVICPKGTEHKDVYDYGKIHSLIDYTADEDGQNFRKANFEYPASLDSKRLAIKYGDEGGKDKDGVIEIRPGVKDLSLGNSAYAQVRILVDDTHYLKGMAMYSNSLPDGIDVLFNTNKESGTPLTKVLKEIKRDKQGNPMENPFGAAIKEGLNDPEDDGDKSDSYGQYYYIDNDGNKKLGLINKTREEGDWNKWSNKVPAQFLSKQNKKLIKTQLDLTVDLKKNEYEKIMEVENPTLRRNLLNSFAEDCDSESVHLKAASFPRQTYQVILPISSMKNDEIFAPNYRNGEKVALIRYPHAGTFEIPILTVNNSQKEARAVLGNKVQDCVGINPEVAKRLSGADFDGDTVMVIPTNDKINITSTHPLKDLENFDMEAEYGASRTETDEDGNVHYYNKAGNEYKIMNDTQNQMGRISNLISDMQIKGANEKELAMAVKHSMVVIDAEKHHYDYRSSEQDNKINYLKQRYQKKIDKETGRVTYGGASTLISKSKGRFDIDKTQGLPKVNVKYDKDGNLNKDYDPTKPEGSLIFKTSDQLYYVQVKVKDENGKTRKIDTYDQTPKFNEDGTFNKESNNNDLEKVVEKIKNGSYSYTVVEGDSKKKVSVTDEPIVVQKRQEHSTNMAETDDARSLISEVNSPVEILYANFANDLKDLANKARLEAYYTKDIPYSASAKLAYQKQVDSLDAQLMKAEKNSPREKQAQLIANSRVSAILAENDDITKDEQKKIRQQELVKARNEVGAHRVTIEISDDEWEAIQAGAISKTKLERIFNHTDTDAIKERATPRSNDKISSSTVSRIKRMAQKGYTAAQISDAIGVSVSTVYQYSRE